MALLLCPFEALFLGSVCLVQVVRFLNFVGEAPNKYFLALLEAQRPSMYVLPLLSVFELYDSFEYCRYLIKPTSRRNDKP